MYRKDAGENGRHRMGIPFVNPGMTNILNEIEKEKTCSKVRYFFNFNIDEYEMLMSAVEQGIDVFPLLKEYFEQDVLPPFSNYLRSKHPTIDMTAFMKKWYEQASREMSAFLQKNEEQ